jgi:hypothetical protein
MSAITVPVRSAEILGGFRADPVFHLRMQARICFMQRKMPQRKMQRKSACAGLPAHAQFLKIIMVCPPLAGAQQ